MLNFIWSAIKQIILFIAVTGEKKIYDMLALEPLERLSIHTCIMKIMLLLVKNIL